MVKGMAVACALAAAAMGVAGCSSGGGSGGTTCHLYAAGQADNNGRVSDVQITTQGGQSCASWLKSLASEGLNWSNGMDPSFDAANPDNPDTNTNGDWMPFSQNCQLSNGGGTLSVFSDGDTPLATQTCSGYESTGWTPQMTKEQAQASASAAAAQASAAAQAHAAAAIPCWVSVNSTDGSNDGATIAVANASSGKVNCNAALSSLEQAMPGFSESLTSPLSPDQMVPSNYACSGWYDGYEVDVIPNNTDEEEFGAEVCGGGLGIQ